MIYVFRTLHLVGFVLQGGETLHKKLIAFRTHIQSLTGLIQDLGSLELALTNTIIAAFLLFVAVQAILNQNDKEALEYLFVLFKDFR